MPVEVAGDTLAKDCESTRHQRHRDPDAKERAAVKGQGVELRGADVSPLLLCQSIKSDAVKVKVMLRNPRSKSRTPSPFESPIMKTSGPKVINLMLGVPPP